MSRLSRTTRGRLAAGAATFIVLTAGALTSATGVESLQVREPDRPRSADAAERWWASCVDGLPFSADTAERWAAKCW
jgi:hypothetical protein